MGALFAVVAPVNDEEKFQKNVLASPGLVEVGAAIVPVRGAWCAADAFWNGQCVIGQAAPWILFCHQDVFFEAGAGPLIEAALAKIPESEARSTVIGFIGLNAGSTLGGFRIVGHVTDIRDRGNGPIVLDGPETETAESIDELAVILHRDSKLEIDSALGWHLWATDLCLQALDRGGKARVIRAPVIHNTTSPFTLPPEFSESAQVLLKKHRGRKTIVSLCGVFKPGGN